jgi:hypothetical protein
MLVWLTLVWAVFLILDTHTHTPQEPGNTEYAIDERKVTKNLYE